MTPQASDATGSPRTQAWAWLEGSGLEANSTCMNAVMGALTRGKGWRPLPAAGLQGMPPCIGAPTGMPLPDIASWPPSATTVARYY